MTDQQKRHQEVKCLLESRFRGTVESMDIRPHKKHALEVVFVPSSHMTEQHAKGEADLMAALLNSGGFSRVEIIFKYKETPVPENTITLKKM